MGAPLEGGAPWQAEQCLSSTAWAAQYALAGALGASLAADLPSVVAGLAVFSGALALPSLLLLPLALALLVARVRLAAAELRAEQRPNQQGARPVARGQREDPVRVHAYQAPKIEGAF
jgi:hypothetical protein